MLEADDLQVPGAVQSEIGPDNQFTKEGQISFEIKKQSTQSVVPNLLTRRTHIFDLAEHEH